MIRKFTFPALVAVMVTALPLVFIEFLENGRKAHNPESSTINIPRHDAVLNRLFADPVINDSIPHYQYVQVQDSIERDRDAGGLKTKTQVIEGRSYGPLGTYKVATGPGNADTSWFLGLNGYDLYENEMFFTYNEVPHLAIVKWSKENSEGSARIGQYESKKIPVRFIREDKRILIPVSLANYNALTIGMKIMMYGTMLLLAYFFIGLPAQVLWSISKGKAFTALNVRRLRTTAWAMLGFALLSILAPHILHVIFKGFIPPEFEMHLIGHSIIRNAHLLLAALVLFLIVKAFEKGSTLQYEQQLTI